MKTLEEQVLAVDLKGNHDENALKHKSDLERGEVRHGVESVVAPGDYRWRGEHATFRQARNLILKVAGGHIADFAECVCHLRTDLVQFYTQHLRGHQRRRFPITAEA